MTEKEEKAIEYTKEILKYQKLYASTEKDEDFLRVIDKEAIETVLKVLEQKDKEIKNSIPQNKIKEQLDKLDLDQEEQDSWDELCGSLAVTLFCKQLLKNQNY